MLEKIQNRLNKEVEKILEKDELTIPDYFFLESIISKSKFEKDYNNNQLLTSKLFDKAFDYLNKEEKEG